MPSHTCIFHFCCLVNGLWQSKLHFLSEAVCLYALQNFTWGDFWDAWNMVQLLCVSSLYKRSLRLLHALLLRVVSMWLRRCLDDVLTLETVSVRFCWVFTHLTVSYSVQLDAKALSNSSHAFRAPASWPLPCMMHVKLLFQDPSMTGAVKVKKLSALTPFTISSLSPWGWMSYKLPMFKCLNTEKRGG